MAAPASPSSGPLARRPGMPGMSGLPPRPHGPTGRPPGPPTPTDVRGSGFYARHGCFTFLLAFVGVTAAQIVAPDLKALTWIFWIIALTISGQIVGRSQGFDKQEISRVTNWGAGFFFLMFLCEVGALRIGAFLAQPQRVSNMGLPPSSSCSISPSGSSGTGKNDGSAIRGSRYLPEDIGAYLRLVADLGKLEKEGARAFSDNPTDDQVIRYLESSRSDWVRMQDRFEAHSPGTPEVQKIHREVKRHLARRIEIHRDLAVAVRNKDFPRLERLVKDFQNCQNGMAQVGKELGQLAVQHRVDVTRYGF